MGPVCFLHIPKTSGSSVELYLKGQFDRAEVCPARYDEDYRAQPRTESWPDYYASQLLTWRDAAVA